MLREILSIPLALVVEEKSVILLFGATTIFTPSMVMGIFQGYRYQRHLKKVLWSPTTGFTMLQAAMAFDLMEAPLVFAVPHITMLQGKRAVE